MSHPIQDTYTDEHGTYRFRENKIVRFLLDAGPFDMNSIAAMDFSDEDRMQFAQLIGYSLSGYASLSYVDDHTYEVAHVMHTEGLSQEQAEIQRLRELVAELKEGLREPMARLYEIHPSDLG